MADPVILYSGPIVTRAEAKVAGLTRYFTGKPCPHGHICQRWTSGTACMACAEERRRRNPDLNYAIVKAWRARNPDKHYEQNRRYHERYPDRQPAISKRYREKNGDRLRPVEAERGRAKRKSDPEANRRRLAVFRARREEALAAIAGTPRPDVCELCFEKSKIVFDHCHRFNQFRGWICDRCNKVLGLVEDSIPLLRMMADYVERANVKVDGRKTE